MAFAQKLKMYKQLGFDGVQFHDDDAVPELENLSPAEITKKAAEVKKALDGEGLVAEFVAPRLWESPKGIDGAYTSNDPKCRQWAIERSKRMIDILQRAGHAAGGPLAGPRRHVYPRVEECARVAQVSGRGA